MTKFQISHQSDNVIRHGQVRDGRGEQRTVGQHHGLNLVLPHHGRHTPEWERRCFGTHIHPEKRRIHFGVYVSVVISHINPYKYMHTYMALAW